MMVSVRSTANIFNPFSRTQPSPLAELSDFRDEYPHTEHSVPTPDIKFPEPLLFTPTVSRRTSVSESASIQSEPSIMSPYQSRFDDPASPPPESDIQAQIRNERKYRLLLTHEYHPSRAFLVSL